MLYTLSDRPAALIAVQCMDGLGAGIFGVVGVLIVADLTKGTGRFNAAQGAIATAQGCGAFLSNYVAGYRRQAHGRRLHLSVLAGIAVGGLVFFWLLDARDPGQRPTTADDGGRCSRSHAARDATRFRPSLPRLSPMPSIPPLPSGSSPR